MRHIVAPLAVLALLIAPSIGDLLARGANACTVAPCCVGKSKACPMHPHPSSGGFGIRSCGSDEQAAVAHQIIAVFAAPVRAVAIAPQQVLHTDFVTPSYPETAPPDPPPPRIAS